MKFSVPLICLALMVDRAAAQTSRPSDERLRAIAERVVTLDADRQLRTASAATIDSLLAFYADSVVYEHPSVGAVVRGKSNLRTGMLRYLGSRESRPNAPTRFTVGAGVVVVEIPAGPDPRNPGAVIPIDRRAFRLLEFDAGGLVKRILDYPW